MGSSLDVIILDSASTTTCFKYKPYVNEIHQMTDSQKLKLFPSGRLTKKFETTRNMYM